MRFQPKSEKEAQAERNIVLPKGEYDFEVMHAEDAMSKSSNEMIHLTLHVFGERHVIVHDYLMEKIAYKMRHFCVMAGLSKQYESGLLQASDCYGVAGRVKLGIETDKTGTYPDKNRVEDYLVPEALKSQQTDKAQPTKPKDDSIPF